MFKEFNSLLELITVFPDEQTCIEYLEYVRWEGNVVSPYDHHPRCTNARGIIISARIQVNISMRKQVQCFIRSSIPLQKWFVAIWLVTSHKKGISSVQLGKDISVTQKTAWFMLQRIHNCFNIEIKEPCLKGEIEVDETYIGGKNKNRHSKDKVKDAQGDL